MLQLPAGGGLVQPERQNWGLKSPHCRILHNSPSGDDALVSIASTPHTVKAHVFFVCCCRSMTGWTGTAVASHLIQRSCAWRTCCTPSVATPRTCCWSTSWQVSLTGFVQYTLIFVHYQNDACPETLQGLRGAFCLCAQRLLNYSRSEDKFTDLCFD